MRQVSDEDLARITGLLRELVDVVTGLGLMPQEEKKPKKGSAANAKAQEVLNYYRKVHPTKGRGVKPGHSSFVLIKKRLEVFTVEELKQAIDANLQCDWHQGVNGGHSLKMVFRNDDKVESYLHKAKKKESLRVGHHPGDEEHHDGPQKFKAEGRLPGQDSGDHQEKKQRRRD